MNQRGKLQQISLAFSINLVKLYDQIERKTFLKQQLARSGTSIGANIHEAEYAESPDDFVHKLKIALKECNETQYWLEILSASAPELNQTIKPLQHEAGSIRRMLIASITTVQASKSRSEGRK